MGHFDRRAFLKVGSLSLFGWMGYGDVLRLRAQAPAAKPPKRDLSVIHLWLTGGMSQLDTFDPKPGIDSTYRSLFKPIPTNVSGLQICEHLPLTALQADKYVVIRSMTHKQAAHEAACSLILSGHRPLATIENPRRANGRIQRTGASKRVTSGRLDSRRNGRLGKSRFPRAAIQPFQRRQPQ